MRATTKLLIGGLLASGCANDPEYIDAPTSLEAGMMDAMGNLVTAKASLTLPIKTESASDMAKRTARAQQLMIDIVPYVKVSDLAVSLEWTIKNLDQAPGHARIILNGANELFSFDPAMVVLDPTNDEAPPTPDLQGDIPLDIAAGEELNGVFREDQILEASIDLDQITRGNVSPFKAILTVNKNDTFFQPLTTPVAPTVAMPDPVQMPLGNPIPREAFAQMVTFNLQFVPDHHMVLEYNLRVRDLRGIMDDLLLDAPAAQLQTFTPMSYVPVPLTEP